jgi:hypothetical protein
MSRLRVKLAIGVAVIGAAATTAAAVAGGGGKLRTQLTGYEEVPALSTPGVGSFKARISRSTDAIRYELRYDGLESPATQAHIHFEQRTNAGPIVVFLCSNLAGAPAGTQPCPAGGGTVRGTITPDDVSAGPASAAAVAAGLGAGEFDELVSAIRAGATYVNVHSVDRPGGEIRGQLGGRRHHDGEHH